MGLHTELSCPKCSRDHGTLIHMLWRCPQLHRYWESILNIMNQAFQTTLTPDAKCCILGIVDDVVADQFNREAVSRVLFQAHKVVIKMRTVASRVPTSSFKMYS